MLVFECKQFIGYMVHDTLVHKANSCKDGQIGHIGCIHLLACDAIKMNVSQRPVHKQCLF